MMVKPVGHRVNRQAALESHAAEAQQRVSDREPLRALHENFDRQASLTLAGLHPGRRRTQSSESAAMATRATSASRS